MAKSLIGSCMSTDSKPTKTALHRRVNTIFKVELIVLILTTSFVVYSKKDGWCVGFSRRE